MSIRLYFLGTLVSLSLLGTLLYQPGLSGVFLFDDFVNLEGLAQLQQQNTLSAKIDFALAGGASQVGRPLSLFSFALQAEHWSAPYPFKLVNLLLHLCNAALVFILIWQLSSLLKLPDTSRRFFAFLTALLWLAHPLQVSTALYVVQRMTELAAFFTLAGLVLYLHARLQLAQQNIQIAFVWMSVAIGLGLILGVLSKENAILLPLYVLVLEFTLLQAVPRPKNWQLWAGIFLYLPLLLLVAWCVLRFESLTQGYALRDFTLRTLAYPTRVLLDYFSQIWLPRPSELSLFHDDFSVSHGWLAPPQTLLVLLFWIVLLAVAAYWRKTAPILAFALFWFLGGHWLEASFFPLMLHFEHRNYLPLFGIMLLIAWVVVHLPGWLAHSSQLLRYSLYSFVALWLLSYPLFTYLETQLWGQAIQQAVQWAERKPASVMAQAHAAQVMRDYQNPQAALFYYQRMAQQHPEKTAPAAYQMLLSCAFSEIAPPSVDTVATHFQQSRSQAGTDSVLNDLAQAVLRQECPVLGLAEASKLFAALAQNTHLTRHDQAFAQLLYARLLVAQENYPQALQASTQALESGALLSNGAARNNLQARALRLHCWLALKDYPQAKQELASLQAHLDARSQPLYANLIQAAQTELSQQP